MLPWAAHAAGNGLPVAAVYSAADKHSSLAPELPSGSHSSVETSSPPVHVPPPVPEATDAVPHTGLTAHPPPAHGSPLQHEPAGQLLHTDVVRHTAQPTSFGCSNAQTDGSQRSSGHSAPLDPGAQHGWSAGMHARPQWCCPAGQSLLPAVAFCEQQNCAVVPDGKAAAHAPAALEKHPPPAAFVQ